eukprot:gene18890-20487_t
MPVAELLGGCSAAVSSHAEVRAKPSLPSTTCDAADAAPGSVVATRQGMPAVRAAATTAPAASVHSPLPHSTPSSTTRSRQYPSVVPSWVWRLYIPTPWEPQCSVSSAVLAARPAASKTHAWPHPHATVGFAMRS